MTSIKRFSSILLAGCAMATLSACGADDVASPGDGVIVVPPPAPTPSPTPSPSPTPTPTTPPSASCPAGLTDRGTITLGNGNVRRNCELSGRTSGNLQLSNIAGTIYSISGRVDVGTDIGANGSAAGGQQHTLSIDPGVVVFASSGNDYLVVNRGSRLVAEGLPDNPIIFTARANVVGTATDNSQGLWGGIVLLGRAPIAECLAGSGGTPGTVSCENQIEGASGGALYGGATPTDNSGTLRYVQIRYSGFEIAPANELQALTTGGVGSGTILEYIHTHNSSDDGVEFFGGRHNIKHLVVTGADDDSVDTDFGYKGFMQFVLVVQRAGGNSGDAIIEAGTSNLSANNPNPRHSVVMSNFTFIHRSTITASANAVLIRGGADYRLANGVIVTPRFCLDFDDAQTTQAAGTITGSNPSGAPGSDELGPPKLDSVLMQCGEGAYRTDGNQADVQAAFEAGTNNNAAYSPTLASIFINGANETAPWFNVTTFGSFFETVDYIGAVRDANDIWYRGWTCDSSTADFGSGSLCTSLPSI